MKPVDEFDLPPEKADDLAKARRLEIWTLLYIASSVILIGYTMSTSQAMRTSFFENALSAIPAAVFLLCARIARRQPDKEFPYGYHGVVSVGYLAASLAIFAMGGFLLYEAVAKIIAVERTTIGGITLFGHTMWGGWPMLAAVTYSTIPTIFLGRAKLQLAPRIHDKILYADAQMMKADWMTEAATACGVLGVGFGLWWLDPLAAALVSADIIKDGAANAYVAVRDLMEHRPMKTDRSGPEPLPEQLREFIDGLDWVADATVRLREVGHVFFGEVFVTPRGAPQDLPAKIRRAMADAKTINWRLHDVTITVVDAEPEQNERKEVA
jgi:cation diffusion facilitator family transporter